jgi:hypothetical protein
MFAQNAPRAFRASKAVPVNVSSRCTRSACPASSMGATRSRESGRRPAIVDKAGGTPGLRIGVRGLVLTATAVSAAAGFYFWHTTHSLPMSLGSSIVVALVGITTTWLTAHEETRRVQAREQGATERERIRHTAEIQLAETQKLLIQATTCGPSATPGDAEALRRDARRAFEMSRPTTVKDAMHITHLPETLNARQAHSNTT